MNQNKNIQVLIIEDDPAHAEILRDNLDTAGGMDVALAKNLEIGLKTVNESPPDIVLIDLHLPDGSALDFLSQTQGRFPVVTLTNKGSEEQAVEVLKTGALDYIIKTTESFAAMPRLLERALREWRLQQQNELAIAKLRSSEQRFHLLLQNVQSVAVQGYLADGTIFYWNKASEDLYGYTSDEAIGNNLFELLIPAEDREAAQRLVTNLITSGTALPPEELTVRHKDGSSLIIYSSNVVVNGNDRPLEIYCVDVDISDRKAAENRMREQMSLVEALLQNTAIPIFVIDPEHRVFIWNKACEKLTGVMARDVVGTNRHWSGFYQEPRPCLADLILDGNAKEDIQTLYPHHSRPEFLEEGLQSESWIKGPNGEPVYITFNAALVRDADGNVIGAVETLQDITARKKAEDALLASRENLRLQHDKLEQVNRDLKQAHVKQLQSEKMASIGQLAAGVAHEINNPIGFVSSNLRSLEKYLARLREFILFQDEELARDENSGLRETIAEKRRQLKIDMILEDIGDLLSESRDGVDRVGKIVSDLKGFSRVDEAEHKLMDVRECLESSINIVWNEIKYKATLSRDFAEVPDILCYPGQLNQVFVNLLINAAQSIAEQGTITVKTFTSEGYVYVQISDSGCGINEDNCKRIFDPFFTTKEVGKGTGLGLSISYDIIKKHQGEISVESELNEGTTFTLKLPISPESPTGPE
mgnify:CR=1 FL=1